jgi:uncharacterized LabA/DUF88 family protein
MRQFRTYAFIDGAYLRERADAAGKSWADPRGFAHLLCGQNAARSSGSQFETGDKLELHRTLYFDAVPDDEVSDDLRGYWRAIEVLPDTHLGFGTVVRTPSGRRRQKGVDTLLAVEMLSGAYDRIFDLALLIAGDADFVPVAKEVCRRGIHVVVAACPENLSEDLRRVADRFVPFDPAAPGGTFRHLEVGGRVWPSRKAT